MVTAAQTGMKAIMTAAISQPMPSAHAGN